MHFYAVCYDKKEHGPDDKLSEVEYKMDYQDHTESRKELSSSTYSIHAYGYMGETPGLASLFEKGPSIKVDLDEEEQELEQEQEPNEKEAQASDGETD